jgi:two-component system cell cycle sensor histidine kinase/response regulator CckA
MQPAPVILILEDHDQARFVIRAVLESEGYSVVEATNEMEAIDVCKRAEQRIDLLISDVILSSAKGTDVAARISALRPTTPVLFMSGFALEDLVSRGLVDGNQFDAARVLFLQKPFAPKILLDSVRQLIRSAPKTGIGPLSC